MNKWNRGPMLSVCQVAALVLLFILSPLVTVAEETRTDPEHADAVPAADEVATKPEPLSPPTHMPESLRATFKNIVVLPTTSPTNKEITGSYQKQTPGLFGGASSGSRLGAGVSRDIYGIRVSFPIRILTLPGALFGGLKGGTQRQIQDFRDALTNSLATAAENPLTNDALASDVFWSLRTVPELKPKVFALTTPIPPDTDAILYVNITDVTINVDGKDAILTTSANATLRRISDGAHVFEKIVQYQDRDTLKNWSANDTALWQDYANYARHYIAREISAESFARISLQRELRPEISANIKNIDDNVWQGVSDTTSPTLTWQFSLLSGGSYGAWAEKVEAANVSFEIEVYDAHQMVYSAKRIMQTNHTVDIALEGCETYRWTVRPVYQIDGDTRYGEWMRAAITAEGGNGNIGKQASSAPAFTYDFPSLKIKCGRRKR